MPPSELGTIAATAALQRAGIQPDQVQHVVFGNVIHTEPEDMYMARVVGIHAGVPKEVPAYTVNRLCGTGVQAIVSLGPGDPDRRGCGCARGRGRIDDPRALLVTAAGASGSAAHGALLLAVYCAGLGVPYLLTGLAFGTATSVLSVVKRH